MLKIFTRKNTDPEAQSGDSSAGFKATNNGNDGKRKSPTPLEVYQSRYKTLYNNYVTIYQDIQQLAGLHDYLKEKLKDTYIRNTSLLQQNTCSTFCHAFKSEDVYTYKEKLIKSFNSINELYLKIQHQSPYYSTNASLFVTKKKGEKKGEIIVSTLPEYEQIKSSFDKINTLHTNLLENKNAIIKKGYNAIELYTQIQNETFTLRENTGTITSDLKRCTPRLVASDGTVLYEGQPISIRTTGKIKVNTSAGYLLSFIGDDHYGIRKDTDGAIVGVSEQRTDDLTHAIGALFHVYGTQKGTVNYGGSTGISLTNGTDFGFYLGGSILFLENNRLVFTAGLSYTKRNVLNTSNLTTSEDGTQLNFISENDTEITYDSLYKPAFFFGVTYNLFNKTEED